MNEYELSQAAAAVFVGRSISQFRRYGLEPRRREGRKYIYDVRDLRKWMDEQAPAKPEELDLTEERAKLARAQTEKYALENAEREGVLVPVDLMVRHWSDVLVAFRSKMTLLRDEVKKHVATGNTARSIGYTVAARINEALAELSEFDPVPAGPARGDPQGAAKRSTPARANGKSVGRRKKKVKSRGKRRARKVANK